MRIPEVIEVPQPCFERAFADPSAANEAQRECGKQLDKLRTQISELVESSEFTATEKRKSVKLQESYLDYLAAVLKACGLAAEYYESLEIDRSGIAEPECFEELIAAYEKVRQSLLGLGYVERLPGETPNLTAHMINAHPEVATKRGQLDTIRAYADSIRAFQQINDRVVANAEAEVSRIKCQSLSSLAV